MNVFDQLDWAARTVQTVRVSRPGIHSIAQDRAAAQVRREAKRRGLGVHINQLAGAFHVRLIDPAEEATQ